MNIESVENSVLNTLDLLREVLDISRVYICRKYGSGNHLTEIIQTAEVCAPGVASRSRKNAETDYPYYKSWDSNFSAQKPVQIKYSALNSDEKSWWQKRDMQSFLAIPISFKESWDGFIGFEDSMNPRDWSASEISFLKSVSKLIDEKHMHLKTNPVFQGTNV